MMDGVPDGMHTSHDSRQEFLTLVKSQNFSLFAKDRVDNDAQSLSPFLKVKNGSSVHKNERTNGGKCVC